MFSISEYAPGLPLPGTLDEVETDFKVGIVCQGLFKCIFSLVSVSVHNNHLALAETEILVSHIAHLVVHYDGCNDQADGNCEL